MIKFIQNNSPYAEGEIAGFSPAIEQRMIDANVAVKVGTKVFGNNSGQVTKPAAVSNSETELKAKKGKCNGRDCDNTSVKSRPKNSKSRKT